MSTPFPHSVDSPIPLRSISVPNAATVPALSDLDDTLSSVQSSETSSSSLALIRARIRKHAQKGRCVASQFRIVLSDHLSKPSTRQSRDYKQLYHDIQGMYVGRVLYENMIYDNVITFRKAERKVNVYVIIWSGKEFVQRIHQIEAIAKDISHTWKQGKKLIVTWGLHRELRTRVNKEARGETHQGILRMETLKQLCLKIWMQYGVNVQTCLDKKEANASIMAIIKAVERGKSDTAIKQKNKSTAILVRDQTGTIREETTHEHGHMYINMLCAIPGVSWERAKRIRTQYPTIRMLINQYEITEITQWWKVVGEITEGQTQRKLGKKIGQKVADVFAATNPNVQLGI